LTATNAAGYTLAVGSKAIVLGDSTLCLEDIVAVARQGGAVTLGAKGRGDMQAARQVIERAMAGGDDAPPVYGVNTGFGALADVRVSPGQIRELQRNLVRSHSVGVGDPLSRQEVRAMMLLRAQVLSRGHSGARPEICDLICDMLDRGMHPEIPCRGSVGASGDLAPLAHLALGMMGEGRAELGGEWMPAGDALRKAGLKPAELEAKEGLTLLNGTQHMTAVGGLSVYDGFQTALAADIAGAMSLEGLLGTARAFDPRVMAARPHAGQMQVAERLRDLLANSEISVSHEDCGKVQDSYSLRCMPQVHGATFDVLNYVRTVLETEANSATDNPLVFIDESAEFGGELISGGNFHGQPVAIALDAAAIGISELANISERRLERLVNPHLSSGLPPFLIPESGLHSGLMIVQVTAAALVSENKILCHPASVDSIPSSAGQEDHVSMGATAALKLKQVCDHSRTVIAIELLAAAQAIDFRAPHKPAARLRPVYECIRDVVATLDGDRALYQDIAAIRKLLDDGTIVEAALGA